jgi:hypothetical protein
MFNLWIITSNAPSFTYATWNPSDKWANITLSGGNLTATTTAAAWDAVRTTISKSSGKHYFEMTITAGTTWWIIGIWNSSATLSFYLWSDANGWGYYTNWQKGNSWLVAYWATYTIGDVIGIAMDMDAGQLTFYKNNVSQGVAFTGITGSLFGMCSLLNIGAASSITANFGATALTYSPPGGFNAWLYN